MSDQEWTVSFGPGGREGIPFPPDPHYTPDTEMVRDHYAADERLGGEHNPEYAAEFGRWLEKALNVARAEAWNDGHDSGIDRVLSGNLYDPESHPNPYRQEAD